jgi:hypothetical protein
MTPVVGEKVHIIERKYFPETYSATWLGRLLSPLRVLYELKDTFGSAIR